MTLRECTAIALLLGVYGLAAGTGPARAAEAGGAGADSTGAAAESPRRLPVASAPT